MIFPLLSLVRQSLERARCQKISLYFATVVIGFDGRSVPVLEQDQSPDPTPRRNHTA